MLRRTRPGKGGDAEYRTTKDVERLRSKTPVVMVCGIIVGEGVSQSRKDAYAWGRIHFTVGSDLAKYRMTLSQSAVVWPSP